ncbi:hypothetical protein L916_11368 [Phytophthora nicotianae]|nr:hypothetical protein L916_11368 [Phytophthora nicotianae]
MTTIANAVQQLASVVAGMQTTSGQFIDDDSTVGSSFISHEPVNSDSNGDAYSRVSGSVHCSTAAHNDDDEYE